MFGNIFIRDAFTFINTTDGYCIGKKDYDGIYKTIYENHTGDKINFYDVLENENQIIVYVLRTCSDRCTGCVQTLR